MKQLLKTFFIMAIIVLALLMASISSTASFTEEEEEEGEEEAFVKDSSSVEGPLSLRGASRFLGQQKRQKVQSCNKNPMVCRGKGSLGPHCCKKKCVNVLTDRLNCGLCGKNCKYNEVCCKGKCVNTSLDKKNCGRCNNKCKKGHFCAYGLCNYA